MRRVVWSRHAHDDFRAVIGHIAEADPAAAHTVAGRIDQTIQALAAVPTGRQGRVSGTYEQLVRGLPYIIAYALGDQPESHAPRGHAPRGHEPRGHETITILHVIHGARDWREDSWPEG